MSETLEIRPKEFKMVDGHAVKEPERLSRSRTVVPVINQEDKRVSSIGGYLYDREGVPDCKAGSRRTEEEVRRALHHPSTLGRNHSGRA